MIFLLLVLLPLVLLFFVSLTNNVEFENNDVKNVLASENIDKGKSILETPPKIATQQSNSMISSRNQN